MKFCELELGDRFRFRLITPATNYTVVLKQDDVIHYTSGDGPLYVILEEYGCSWNAEVHRVSRGNL